MYSGSFTSVINGNTNGYPLPVLAIGARPSKVNYVATRLFLYVNQLNPITSLQLKSWNYGQFSMSIAHSWVNIKNALRDAIRFPYISC